MKIVSFVYNHILRRYQRSRGVGRLAHQAMLGILIRSMSRLGDPGIETEVGGKPMCLPVSHRLPLYVSKFPQHDALLTRLSEHLRRRDGKLSAIDVGANVGDTILACYNHDEDRFLAIEPNPHFGFYFRKNCANVPRCRLLEVVCASSDGAAKFAINEARGTARVTMQTAGRTIESKSLDTIVAENPDAADFNLLKVDTDGHDFDVLRGARSSIAKNLPAVLFECEVFDNERYVEDFVETMELFRDAGYTRALVYEQTGYLFGTLDLHRIGEFKHALLYQLTSSRCDFDILVAPADVIDSFLLAEETHFIESMARQALKPTARAAARL